MRNTPFNSLTNLPQKRPLPLFQVIVADGPDSRHNHVVKFHISVSVEIMEFLYEHALVEPRLGIYQG